MTEIDLEKKINEGSLNGIYLFVGEEKYEIERMLKKIKSKFSNLQVGVNLFHINKDNILQLPNICQSTTFFGEEKLIIVENVNLKIDIKSINQIIDDSTCIIDIEESVDKRTSDYKEFVKLAQVIEFKYLKPKELVRYIMGILKKYNIVANVEDVEYFVEICGLDKFNNINELNKLVSYMGENKVLTKDIINKVCSRTLDAKIFEMLIKIVNKEKEEALKELDDLLSMKESIVKVYIMLYKQVKQMYMIKYLKEKKEENIISVLGIHPFTFRNLNKSCDNYFLKELKELIYMFGEYDRKTKIGELDFEIGLKRIICLM